MKPSLFFHFCCMFFSLLCAVLFTGTPVLADERTPENGNVQRDMSAGELLAAGMYGIDTPAALSLSTQLLPPGELAAASLSDISSMGGQAITLSYQGSAGLLGFSAGYILTDTSDEQQPSRSILLDVHPDAVTMDTPDYAWYMALNFSQLSTGNDKVSFRLTSKAIMRKNPRITSGEKTFSLLFNMPITYADRVTITPEVSWSQALESGLTDPVPSPLSATPVDQEFFGGLSISFSY